MWGSRDPRCRVLYKTFGLLLNQKLERDAQIRFGDVETDLDNPLRADKSTSVRLVKILV